MLYEGTPLAAAFGGEVPHLVLWEICGWHQAISWGKDDVTVRVLDLNGLWHCEEISRRPSAGRMERVHRRILIKRGVHDVLEHCSSCWLGVAKLPCVYEDGVIDEEEEDRWDDVSRHCHGDSYCSFFGIDNVHSWAPCWLDLWTEESRDARGHITVHDAEADVESLAPQHRFWCRIEEFTLNELLRVAASSERLSFIGDLDDYEYDAWDHFMDYRKETLSDWWTYSYERSRAQLLWEREVVEQQDRARRRKRAGRRIEHRLVCKLRKETAIRQEALRRAQKKRGRIAHRKHLKQQLVNRFGVPWDVHRILLKLEFREWDG